MLLLEQEKADSVAQEINMTIDEFLAQRVRERDYLTEQDSEYIQVVNGITDMLTMYGADEKVKGIMANILHYVDTYGHPAGLAQRVWAYDDAVEEAVMDYEKHFGTGSSK